ncbi:MAG TPA: ankyrin repeat domain-containing protein [Tepidisphaeraceae bacterium]|nr:ankyrin repeat domain-containing protein [Tepidisphaeraceae bacterium]
MGAADAMDLLPDDPREFVSEADADALPDDKVLDALCSACIVNDVVTVSRLAKRIDVNALDHNKQTALGYAVGNNNPECVKLLLAHGADSNRVENWGNTAMHVCASSVSSKEIFKMLQAAGGDVNIKNDEGQSVLDLLKQHRRRNWSAG